MNQKILFICRHNAGRSVIAESLAKQYLPSQFAVASGGSHPTGSINPVVKQFLQGKNLPVPHKCAHSWEERTSFLPDIVITLCDSLHNEPTPWWLSGGI
ncbi:TPA: low molecular weight phosphatase family protein [Vibrio cholerae]